MVDVCLLHCYYVTDTYVSGIIRQRYNSTKGKPKP